MTSSTRNAIQNRHSWSSTSTLGNEMDLRSKLFSGDVPASLLGADGLGGKSLFSSVAHRSQQMKKMSNLLNNGVDDELVVEVKDRNGAAIVTPYMLDGQMRYPDEKGQVRLTNSAPVKLAHQIKTYRRERTDRLMEIIMGGGDEVAAYVIGMPLQKWMEMCKGGIDPTTNQTWEDPEMVGINCTVESIERTTAGSILQTRKIGKLRCIAQAFIKNVNIEAFDSVEEKKADMKLGMNADVGAPKHDGEGGMISAQGSGLQSPSALNLE